MQKEWKKYNKKLKRFERKICPKRYKIIAGVDEAGRGPLAGPVVASAVILKKQSLITKIFDSKRISFSIRQRAFSEIITKAYVGVGIIDSQIIDKKNILQATGMAVKKALDNLELKPEHILLDGKFNQWILPFSSQAVIGGDGLCFSIACASIVAKVVRDNLMSCYAALYPKYGFDRNRGYCTQEHLRAIEKFGLTPIHRRSFRPIRKDY